MSAPAEPTPTAQRAAPAPRADGDLGHRPGLAAPGLGQPFGDRPAHDGHRVLLLPRRRAAGHADARAAGHAQGHLHGRRDLQPGLHDARRDDAVPVRDPDARRRGGVPDAEDAGRARLRLPAPDRLQLLVLPVRRVDPARRADPRRRARRRLVHVHAAQLQHLHAGRQRRCLAAGHHLRRDLGAELRRRDRGLDPEDARAGHVAGPHADLRLVHAGHRADDAGGLSAADPGVDPARTGARLRPALLRPHARRRRAAVAAPVLAVRPPRRVHHLPADGRRAVDDDPGVRAARAGRLHDDRRRHRRHGLPQLRHLGAPHVHGGHPAPGAGLLLGRLGHRRGAHRRADVRLAGDAGARQAALGPADALHLRLLLRLRARRADRRDAGHRALRLAGARQLLRRRAPALRGGRGLRLPAAGRRCTTGCRCSPGAARRRGWRCRPSG